MSHRSCGVDVVVEGVTDSPRCPHGPTLLFEKYSESESEGRQFFACSAFRDRKDCSFFQWADETVSAEKQAARDERYRQMEEGILPKEAMKRLSQFRKLPAEDRAICQTCGRLLLPSETEAHGDGHSVTSPVTDEALRRPTNLFSPLENNKTYAQYLFGKSSVEFTLETLRRLSFTRLLCLGAPRIHEAIQILRDSSKETLNSLLLDLDHRFQQIWPAELFCRYNMFNHHLFGGENSEEIFKNFVTGGKSEEKLVIVLDPPFGGMVEALAATLKTISQLRDDETTGELCPVLWFFPYFMERRIQEVCPSLRMLDYKVDYDNHSLFHGGERGRKEGSPVRIFTNLTPAQVVLPISEGYWFCGKCQSYSAPENWHCDKCGSCTSKGGKRYRHCELCERCVKPSRLHCQRCQQCHLPAHTCGDTKSTGCHICGEIGHKRRECPNKNTVKSEKRPGGAVQQESKKNRRK